MNIILIGMSGSGKSFLGKKIADELGFNFIDTDKLLIGKFSGTEQLLKKLGEEKFLKKEEKTILNLKSFDNTIVATGGSVIYKIKSMKKLQNIGKVIWLNESLDRLIMRGNIENRGIIGLKDKPFEQLFRERSVLYRKFCDVEIEKPDEKKLRGVISELIYQKL